MPTKASLVGIFMEDYAKTPMARSAIGVLSGKPDETPTKASSVGILVKENIFGRIEEKEDV